MSKRGNHEGTILKRKKCEECNKIISTSGKDELLVCSNCKSMLPDEYTWFGQLTVGVDPKTGKSKRRSFYDKRRKDLVEKMKKVQNEISKGKYTEPSKMKFTVWLDKWLQSYKKGNLKPSTYDSYENRINVHIKPDLGEIPIEKLQTHMIQDFYNKKLRSGKEDSKGVLSARSVRHLHTIICSSLDQAVQDGLLQINVAKSAKPPIVRRKKMNTMSLDDLVKFVNSVKTDKHYATYIIAITTGLRRGELLGLCWDCVDLDNGTISIERQLLVLKEGVVLDDGTKSKLSRRKVTLTDDGIKALNKHKAKQDGLKKMLTDVGYIDNNLVFSRDDGSFLDPREFTKRFQRNLEKAGLPKIRLHDLRHTHASLLLEKDLHPKIVQDRLGHSSITTTLDIYSHISPGLQKKASDSLKGIFSDKSETSVELLKDK